MALLSPRGGLHLLELGGKKKKKKKNKKKAHDHLDVAPPRRRRCVSVPRFFAAGRARSRAADLVGVADTRRWKAVRSNVNMAAAFLAAGNVDVAAASLAPGSYEDRVNLSASTAFTLDAMASL